MQYNALKETENLKTRGIAGRPIVERIKLLIKKDKNMSIIIPIRGKIQFYKKKYWTMFFFYSDGII